VHLEECESGRIGRSRKPLWSQGHRGFESHLLRSIQPYSRCALSNAGYGRSGLRDQRALQQPATAPLVTVTGKLISWKKPIPEYSFEAFEYVVAM
jgi:hypothetical protein